MAGRPSEALEWLSEDNLTRIRGWARDGLTDKQIAEKKIGISEQTFCKWKKKHEAISLALKKGKQPADIEVEDSLYTSAVGKYVTEERPIKVKTTKKKDGAEITEEHIEVVKVTRYIEPNVTAQIFWLKNRKKDYWKDKPVSENDEVVDRIVERMAEVLNGVDSVIK